MTASQQPTGHDKAVERLAIEVARRRDGFDPLTTRQAVAMFLNVARAALAAGDPDVAAALGLREQARYREPVQPFPEPTPIEIRFVTEWTEA